MEPWKLGRMERIAWNPPMLSFVVERHGGIVAGGSTRAELQGWTIDLERHTAECCKVGWRQAAPMGPRMSVGPIAAEIAAIIEQRRTDPRIKWLDTERTAVRILIGRIIPHDAPNQTVAGRRRRFSNALDEALASTPWRRVFGGAPRTFRMQVPQKGNEDGTAWPAS
jgi:hypothetical protein